MGRWGKTPEPRFAQPEDQAVTKHWLPERRTAAFPHPEEYDVETIG